MEKPAENKSFVPRGFLFFFSSFQNLFMKFVFRQKSVSWHLSPIRAQSAFSISVFSAFQTVLLLCFLLSCASRGASLEQTGCYWSPFTAEKRKKTISPKNHNLRWMFFFSTEGVLESSTVCFLQRVHINIWIVCAAQMAKLVQTGAGGAPPFPPPSSWHVRADTSWTPAASLCCFSARSPGSRQASVFKHHLPRSSVFSHPRPSLHHFTSPSSQIHFIDSEGHPIVSSR